ncbi:uncharacterized protein LOC119570970 [Penaeus monodon]|uniref:uncharacterized protein LOC119570970 n=1 Tax=Penaeus monodon TaxID=6687 RepID=UPI0018A6F435|nr:uncharacterized protein LOC119570970 [Penaeus monodon]
MNNDLRNDSGTLFVVMALLTALASATPSPEPQRDDSLENGAILRDDHLLDDRLLDDRLADDYDRFNFGVEPTNGIFLSESGFGELKNVFRGAGSFSSPLPTAPRSTWSSWWTRTGEASRPTRASCRPSPRSRGRSRSSSSTRSRRPLRRAKHHEPTITSRTPTFPLGLLDISHLIVISVCLVISYFCIDL